MYIYIYIYISLSISLSLSIYIYIYTYTCKYPPHRRRSLAGSRAPWPSGAGPRPPRAITESYYSYAMVDSYNSYKSKL